MALKIKIKWTSHCMKHPKYNPEKQGSGGIRGGCMSCEALLKVYESSLSFKKMMKVCEGTEPTESQSSLALQG